MHPKPFGQGKERVLTPTIALADQALNPITLISSAEILLSYYDEDRRAWLLPFCYGREMIHHPKGIGNEGPPRSKEGVHISLEMQTLFLR
jgi:hypothetical protein